MADSHDYLEIVIADRLRLGNLPGAEITREQSKEVFVKVFPDIVNIHKKTGNTLDTLILLTLCLQARVSSSGILYAKASRRSIASELKISDKTVGLSLKRLRLHGFLDRHIEENNDATYLIFPNGGMEKFHSAKVRQVFLAEVKGNPTFGTSKIGAPLPSNQDVVGGVVTTPPSQNNPRGGVATTPPSGQSYPTPNIEKDILEEKETTTTTERAVSSGGRRNNSSYEEKHEHACLEDLWIRTSVLNLIRDSQVIKLNSRSKLKLIQLGGQCWIVNQALSVLDTNHDRIKSTPFKYLKGVIETIRQEAQDTSPLAVRRWRPETKPFEFPKKRPKEEMTPDITPLPTNPFSDHICREAYETLLNSGEEVEGWARGRFEMVSVDFDNYCRHMEKQNQAQSGG